MRQGLLYVACAYYTFHLCKLVVMRLHHMQNEEGCVYTHINSRSFSTYQLESLEASEPLVMDDVLSSMIQCVLAGAVPVMRPK